MIQRFARHKKIWIAGLACAVVAVGVGMYVFVLRSDVVVSSDVVYMDKSIIEKAKQENKIGTKNWIGGTAPVRYESFLSKGLSIYIVNGSVYDGAYVCTLFDIATWQTYGIYTAWGSEGTPGHEYTYYKNSKINKDTTVQFLKEHCTSALN